MIEYPRVAIYLKVSFPQIIFRNIIKSKIGLDVFENEDFNQQ